MCDDVTPPRLQANMMMAKRVVSGRPSAARRFQAVPVGRSRRQVKAQANLIVQLLASTTAGAAATAVTLVTAGAAERAAPHTERRHPV